MLRKSHALTVVISHCMRFLSKYDIIVIPLYFIDILFNRLHLCFSLITAIVSASLFIIDCAIFSIHLVESRDFMVTCLISMELTAAMVLFLTVLSLLVGGNWTSIYRKMESENDESRQTSLGDWVMRNNIQPSLQILGLILHTHVTLHQNKLLIMMTSWDI